MILRSGSLADHFAGFLYSVGIQLAIVEQCPSPVDVKWILINGLDESVTVSEKAFPFVQISESYTTTVQHSPFGIRVDARNAEDISVGLASGADGIGIVRAEWLDWESERVPTSDRYEECYRNCIKQAGAHTVNIRLLDIGGDKIPHWVGQTSPVLESPLGIRGIRGRAHSTIRMALESQLKAIVRIAKDTPIGVIIPMVTDVDDIAWVKGYLARIGDSDVLDRISVGIMVETPSAALLLNTLLAGVRLVRIGPGDLTQFTTGKLRSMLGPDEYSGHSFHPAVMMLIQTVSRICKEAGVELSLCLDIDPRPQLLYTLLKHGVRTICTSPYAVKRLLSALSSISNVI